MQIALRSTSTLVASLASALITGSCLAAGPSGADILPPTVAAYFELPDPAAALASLLDHPQRERFERLPQVARAKRAPDYLKFKLVLQLIELKLGKTWRPALESLSRHGLHVAVDSATEGIVLLVRCDDPKLARRARDTLLDTARQEAIDDGRQDPVSEVDYRGVTAHQVNELRLAIVDDWFVATNNAELGKQTLDRLLGDQAASLSKLRAFRTAMDERESPLAWAWINLRAWRDAGVAKQLFEGHAEDFGGELILGGVLAAISESSFATVAMELNDGGLTVEATLPRDEKAESPRHEYFFGVGDQGAAPPPIRTPQSLASVRAHRDVAALWRQSPNIFGQEVNAGLSKAESDLSTLFGGKSFSDEILASLGPEVQLVVARQEFSSPTPAIKLPAAAAVFRLASPETSQRTMKIAFQTIIGFVNIDAGQKGRSPLLMANERLGDATLISTTYDPADAADDGEAELQFNFSPTLAFVDQWLILSSTRGLALDVVSSLSKANPAAAPKAATDDDRVVNSAVELEMPEVAALVSDNRENLIAQNMLEEGSARDEAELHIDTLENVLQALQHARLELINDGDALTIEFEVRWAK